MIRMSVSRLLCGFLLLAASAGCSLGPQSAGDIVSRSVSAHGGPALTRWDTMTVKGTVEMFDGVTFRAAYLVFAKMPGKLRVEKDMTVAQGGRYYYEYFLNNGVAWSRRNLMPAAGDAAQMQSWLNQCYGIAWYAGHADSLTRKEDSVVEWMEKSPGARDFSVAASRPAYVVEAVVAGEKTDLYIDKENFHFLQESKDKLKRIFWDFRQFGDVTLPGRILEIADGPRGKVFTPYTYDEVRYNVPIEDWLFTEDMP